MKNISLAAANREADRQTDRAIELGILKPIVAAQKGWNSKTYIDLREALAKGAMKGKSKKAIDKMVAGYAKQDIEHYGTKRDFIKSGAFAAAKEAIAKAKR